MKGYKTTSKDFDIFKKEGLKWQNYFGLKEWSISYVHIKLEGVFGECSAIIPGKVCCIRLNTQPGEPFNVRKTAFHEICELLLWELSDMAHAAYSKNMAEASTHDIIRRLENTVFEESL